MRPRDFLLDLHLTHLARGRNQSEFRAFAESLHFIKIVGHVMTSLRLVELALASKRCSSWDYTKRIGTRSCGDRPRAFERETELNRLLYRLG